MFSSILYKFGHCCVFRGLFIFILTCLMMVSHAVTIALINS